MKIESIASKEIESLEDLFSGDFCECGHLLWEHSSWKCRALLYNGTVWYGCDCKGPKIKQFEIRVEIYASIQTNST